jgi:hypothetical protein
MDAMRLRYETGIAAMIQFLVLALLNFVNAIASAIDACHGGTDAYSCVSGVGIDLLYVLVIAAWFGFIWVLAYAAQDRRDHRLATILIGAEGMVLIVALFNAKHLPNILGLITSLTDAVLAAWVIFLAFKILRAKGGRITARRTSRPRQRISTEN